MTSAAAVTKTQNGNTPDLGTVVGTQTKLMSAVAELMGSLGTADAAQLKRVNDLLTAGLASVRGEISSPEVVATEPKSIELRRQEFITKYNVKVLGEGKVSFTLPADTSRLDLINDAQSLAPELLGQNAVYGRRLEAWEKDPAFTTKVIENTDKSIDGNVRCSTNKSRSEQEAKGWNNVDLCDLVVAHQAYLIATSGKDLFGGNVVRARAGALLFNDGGLFANDYGADFRFSFIAASSALPVRN